jgi:hypothetical protein
MLSLSVTKNDAQALADFLQKRSGYHPAHIRVLIDHKATREELEQGFTWLRDCVTNDPEATAVIYYSGHGADLPDRSYYLIPYETDLHNIPGTALPIATFDRWLANVRAKRLVVFLDCCHAGSAALTKDVPQFTIKAPNPELLQGGSERALIASSTDRQKSYILSGHSNSLFTEVLLEGLVQPGEIEVMDIFKTLRQEVSRRASAAGFEQTPRFHAASLSRIVLAAN